MPFISFDKEARLITFDLSLVEKGQKDFNLILKLSSTSGLEKTYQVMLKLKKSASAADNKNNVSGNGADLEEMKEIASKEKEVVQDIDKRDDNDDSQWKI